VGRSEGDGSPKTLRLTLPEAVERLTFDREFHARNFTLAENSLTTDIPWRPGNQTLKLMYRLPADQRHKLLARLVDLPTYDVRIRIVADDTSHVACNVGDAVLRRDGELTFERRATGDPLPVGYSIELQLGSLPIGFDDYARGTAVFVLCALILATLVFVRWRRPRPGCAEDSGEVHSPSTPKRRRRAA
jgi:hypothetical protein